MKIPKLIEEQMKEFDEKFSDYIKTISIGQYDNSGVNVGFLSAKDAISKWNTDVFRKLIEALGEEIIGESEKPLFSERYKCKGSEEKTLRKTRKKRVERYAAPQVKRNYK